jgi:hypothetical protein
MTNSTCYIDTMTVLVITKIIYLEIWSAYNDLENNVANSYASRKTMSYLSKIGCPSDFSDSFITQLYQY